MVGLNMFALLLVSTTGYIFSAFGKECTLPKPQHIDWNKMSGNWYETAHSGSDFSEAAGRMVFHSITQVADGVELLIDDPNIESGDKTVSYHWIEQRPDVYVDDRESERNLIAKLKGRCQDDKFTNFVQEAETWQEEIGFTDYENYFMGLQCGAGGEKYIYIHHRNPNPAAADILQIWRKLIEIGGGWEDVPLYSVDALNEAAS